MALSFFEIQDVLIYKIERAVGDNLIDDILAGLSILNWKIKVNGYIPVSRIADEISFECFAVDFDSFLVALLGKGGERSQANQERKKKKLLHRFMGLG
ncbi:hypothetical protein [Algoriphagus boritolerans]|uniref:hypothetical protein n=1 Tax=Algoriphagus boritolerans TaxID=308111 RepID=UPI000A3F1F64